MAERQGISPFSIPKITELFQQPWTGLEDPDSAALLGTLRQLSANFYKTLNQSYYNVADIKLVLDRAATRHLLTRPAGSAEHGWKYRTVELKCLDWLDCKETNAPVTQVPQFLEFGLACNLRKFIIDMTSCPMFQRPHLMKLLDFVANCGQYPLLASVVIIDVNFRLCDRMLEILGSFPPHVRITIQLSRTKPSKLVELVKALNSSNMVLTVDTLEIRSFFELKNLALELQDWYKSSPDSWIGELGFYLDDASFPYEVQEAGLDCLDSLLELLKPKKLIWNQIHLTDEIKWDLLGGLTKRKEMRDLTGSNEQHWSGSLKKLMVMGYQHPITLPALFSAASTQDEEKKGTKSDHELKQGLETFRLIKFRILECFYPNEEPDLGHVFGDVCKNASVELNLSRFANGFNRLWLQRDQIESEVGKLIIMWDSAGWAQAQE